MACLKRPQGKEKAGADRVRQDQGSHTFIRVREWSALGFLG